MAGDLRRLEVVSGRVKNQYQAVDRRVQADVTRLGQVWFFGEGVETHSENVEARPALRPEAGDDPGICGAVGVEGLIPRGPMKVHRETDPIDFSTLNGSALDASRTAEESSFVVPNFEVSAEEFGEPFIGQTHVFLPLRRESCFATDQRILSIIDILSS